MHPDIIVSIICIIALLATPIIYWVNSSKEEFDKAFTITISIAGISSSTFIIYLAYHLYN